MEAAAEEVGDDGHVILQQIYAEEAAEIEHERTIMPDSEVEARCCGKCAY